MSKNTFPKTVKAGSARVKVFRYLNKGHTYYRVDWRMAGKRHTENYTDERSALDAAAAKAAQLSRGDIDAAQIRGSDRLIYGRAQEFLKDTGLPVDLAAAQLAEVFPLLQGTPLIDAVRFWALHNAPDVERRLVSDVVTELLAARRTSGCSKRYLGDLRVRLGRFSASFQCPISSVTQDLAQRWLSEVATSPQNHNNFRTVLSTLFRFAQTKRYVPEDFNPIGSLGRRKVVGTETEVFTPAEMTRLLETSSPELIPLLALGAFAGLRREELLKMEWEDLKHESGVIQVSASKAKTASRRTVPITDNLKAWLRPFVGRSGLIWSGTEWAQTKEQKRIAGEADVRWKDNGLRHSFISYRLAILQDENEVALEAGNSPAMIHQHYKALVTRSEAEAWFSIQPKL
jgi:integrase